MADEGCDTRQLLGSASTLAAAASWLHVAFGCVDDFHKFLSHNVNGALLHCDDARPRH